MHHAAAQHLQPAALAADPAALAATDDTFDVHLRRRFGEGKVGRPETHAEIALKKVFQEIVQDALEVGETHVGIDQQAFDLVEHGCVGQIRVAAIDPARRNDSQRRLALLHHPDLHRGGMGAQHPAILEVKGVVHGPRRMMGRDVERLEVVVVVLDLGAFRDLEAELAEQRLDTRQRPGDGVQPARAAAAPGQGHV